MRKLAGYAGVLAVTVVIAPRVTAHHGFGTFLMDKDVEITGTVTGLDFVNPHSWLHVRSTNPQGRPVTWSFEMGSVGQLVRDKWERDTVKVGDQVTIAFHPLRDGSYGGQFRIVKFPDGRAVCQAGGGNAACRLNQNNELEPVTGGN